jgi:hypothetical protein
VGRVARSSDLLWWTLRMDQPGVSGAADFRGFLGSGPDFTALELVRPREPARAIDLDRVDSAAEGVDEP